MTLDPYLTPTTLANKNVQIILRTALCHFINLVGNCHRDNDGAIYAAQLRRKTHCNTHTHCFTKIQQKYRMCFIRRVCVLHKARAALTR